MLILIILSIGLYVVKGLKELPSNVSVLDAGGSDVLEPWAMCIWRLLVGFFALGLSISYVLNPEGILIETPRLAGSKLPPSSSLKWRHAGLRRLFSFTVQSWTFLGFYFLGAGYFSFQLYKSNPDKVPSAVPSRQFAIVESSRLCKYLQIAYEIALTSSLMIDVIVTYVIIPSTMKRGGNMIRICFNTNSLITHNLNLVIMLTEMYLNRWHISIWHFGVVLAW